MTSERSRRLKTGRPLGMRCEVVTVGFIGEDEIDWDGYEGDDCSICHGRVKRGERIVALPMTLLPGTVVVHFAELEQLMSHVEYDHRDLPDELQAIRDKLLSDLP